MTIIRITLPQNEDKPLLAAIEKGVNSAWDFFITDTLPKYYSEQNWKLGTRAAIEKLFTQRHVDLKNEIIESVNLYLDEIINIKLPTAMMTIEHSSSEEAIPVQDTDLHPLIDPVKLAEEERIKLDADALLAWLEDCWSEPHVSLGAIQQGISTRKLYKRDVAADAVYELQKRGILIRDRIPKQVRGKNVHKSWTVNIPIEEEATSEIKETSPKVIYFAQTDMMDSELSVQHSDSTVDAQVEIMDEVARAWHSSQKPQSKKQTVDDIEKENKDALIQKIIADNKNAKSPSLFTRIYPEAVTNKILKLFRKYREQYPYPQHSKTLIAELIYKIDKPLNLKGRPYSPRSLYNMLSLITKGEL